MPYRIVVDTCVAMSAGFSGSSARHCLDTLEAVRTQGHCLVMNQPIHDEWLREVEGRPEYSFALHLSLYAYYWYTYMRSFRRVVDVHFCQRPDLLACILQSADASAATAINKDYPLIDAAIATDRRIVSLDDKMRHIMGRLSDEIVELTVILWVHPVTHDAPAWLTAGAQDVESFHLGP